MFLQLQRELDALRITQQRVPVMVLHNNAWVERGPDNVGGRTRAVTF